MFLLLSHVLEIQLHATHVTKIPCNCFEQVAVDMQLHVIILSNYIYNMVIHFYIYD